MTRACIHLERAEEAVTIDIMTGREEPSEGPMLCAWAINVAPTQLVGVPRWLSRNALAGHLINHPADCRNCPCFEEKRK